MNPGRAHAPGKLKVGNFLFFAHFGKPDRPDFDLDSTSPADADPKCGLCEGKHPANYRGCPEYKKIVKKSTCEDKTVTYKPTSNTTHPSASYAETAAQKEPIIQTAEPHPPHNPSGQVRLEHLMEQIINQNAQILALLTTLIAKLKQWKKMSQPFLHVKLLEY